jgi:hypothetical protein
MKSLVVTKAKGSSKLIKNNESLTPLVKRNPQIKTSGRYGSP